MEKSGNNPSVANFYKREIPQPPTKPAPPLPISKEQSEAIQNQSKQIMENLQSPPAAPPKDLSKRLSKEIPAQTARGFTPLAAPPSKNDNFKLLRSERMYHLPIKPAAEKPAAAEVQRLQTPSTPVVVTSVTVKELYDTAKALKTSCEPKAELRKRIDKGKEDGTVSMFTKQPPADLAADAKSTVRDARQIKMTITTAGYATAGNADSKIEIIAGDKQQGGGHAGMLAAQEEIAVEKSIGLASIAEKKLMAPAMRSGGPKAGEGKSLGGYIKNIPVDYEINAFKPLEHKAVKGKNIYATNFEMNYRAFDKETKKGVAGYIDQLFKEGVITKKPPNSKMDYLYVVAPKPAPNSPIVKEQMLDLFNTFTTGYQSLMEANKGANPVVIPGGWVGCGAFNNNYQASAIAQLVAVHFAADAQKLDPKQGVEFVFHDTGRPADQGERATALRQAKVFYEKELKPMIEKGATKEEIALKVVEYAAEKKWVNRAASND